MYTVQRCSLSLPVFRILVLRMLEGDDYNTPPPGGKKLLIQPEGKEAAWSDVSAAQAKAERAVNKQSLLAAAQEDQEKNVGAEYEEGDHDEEDHQKKAGVEHEEGDHDEEVVAAASPAQCAPAYTCWRRRCRWRGPSRRPPRCRTVLKHGRGRHKLETKAAIAGHDE